MEWIKQIKLTDGLIAQLRRLATIKTFDSKSPLFYEGQVPIVAYLILKGNIQLSKKKKVQNILRPGQILGLTEIMHRLPCEFSAEAQNNTTVCFIDSSTIKEIANGSHSDLAFLLEKNVVENA